MATPQLPDALATSLLANRYRITRRIGHGNIADVYLGHDLLLERPVAIKLLHPRLASDASELEWFRIEGRTLAAIESPHVVSVYDIAIEHDTAYLAMQYVAGQTLEQLVAKHGPLTGEEAAKIMLQVLDGLAALHERALAHRDLRPSNVAVDTNGRVVLLDLGAASRPNGVVPELSAPHRRVLHMTDLRCDIYQVGMLMIFLFTGVDAAKHPFTERVALVERMPAGYATIARRALSAAPQRYASASAMAQAIASTRASAK